MSIFNQLNTIEKKDPPPDHSGAGFLIPDLVDVFFEDLAFVWYHLTSTRGDYDLDLERYDGASLGEESSWFEEYKDVGDIETFLMPWRSVQTPEGWSFTTTGADFALLHGIAPWQPFLLSFGIPKYFRSSYEYNEWDVNYDVEIVRVKPWKATFIQRSWENFHNGRQAFFEKARTSMRLLLEMQRMDVSAMYITKELYFTGYYDEMTPPNGKRVQLRTKHTSVPGLMKYSQGVLASGQHDEDWEKAWDRLYADAKKKLNLERDVIDRLPKKWL